MISLKGLYLLKLKYFKNDSDDKILIGTASSNHLRNSKKILTIDERKRISISENNDAKYIIDNYRHWHGISKKQFHISEDFKIYKEIFVGKQNPSSQ